MNSRHNNPRFPSSHNNGGPGRLRPKPIQTHAGIRSPATHASGTKLFAFKKPIQNSPAFVVQVRFVISPISKKPAPGSKPQGSASAPT